MAVTWTPSRDLTAPEDRPLWAWVKTFGPQVAKGYDFPGCSDWSGPAHLCACETWRGAACPRCGETIKDGEVIAGKYGADVWADGDRCDWYETWHVRCPS